LRRGYSDGGDRTGGDEGGTEVVDGIDAESLGDQRHHDALERGVALVLTLLKMTASCVRGPLAAVEVVLVAGGEFHDHSTNRRADRFGARQSEHDEFDVAPQPRAVRPGLRPGFNGPLVFAVDLGSAQNSATLDRMSSAVAADPDVAEVAQPMIGPNGTTAVIQVTPRSAPQDAATSELANRLRHDVLPVAVADSSVHVYVGGQTAVVHRSVRAGRRSPPAVHGCIVALSFVLLMIVFRSILVPLKAAIMNLLSIVAAYGAHGEVGDCADVEARQSFGWSGELEVRQVWGQGSERCP
jgi:hypothetical protein